MRPKTRLLSTASILAMTAFIAGPTGCDYFSTVTVPASDTTKPDAITALYNPATDGYDQLESNDTSFSTTVPYNIIKYAIGAGMDAGGLKTIRTDFTLRWRCCSTSGACQSGNFFENYTANESQTGSTGSQVSNGIWEGRAFRPSDIIAQKCPSEGGAGPGPEDKVQLSWRSTVTDFKGNTRTGAISYISYNF